MAIFVRPACPLLYTHKLSLLVLVPSRLAQRSSIAPEALRGTLRLSHSISIHRIAQQFSLQRLANLQPNTGSDSRPSSQNPLNLADGSRRWRGYPARAGPAADPRGTARRPPRGWNSSPSRRSSSPACATYPPTACAALLQTSAGWTIACYAAVQCLPLPPIASLIPSPSF